MFGKRWAHQTAEINSPLLEVLPQPTWILPTRGSYTQHSPLCGRRDRRSPLPCSRNPAEALEMLRKPFVHEAPQRDRAKLSESESWPSWPGSCSRYTAIWRPCAAKRSSSSIGWSSASVSDLYWSKLGTVMASIKALSMLRVSQPNSCLACRTRIGVQPRLPILMTFAWKLNRIRTEREPSSRLQKKPSFVIFFY